MFTRRVAHALASGRGMFFIALLAGALTGSAFLGIGDSSHTITAQFSDADGLVGGNEVRIAGVVAGTVDSVLPTVDPSSGRQYATVQFHIDSSHWPLTRGTSVAITPKGVLSNVYLAVSPGPSGNPSLGGSPFFAVGQTQSPVKLSELSNVFTPSVRTAIRTQLQEGVLALGGAGAPDLNSTLLYADPLTRDTVPISEVLAGRTPQLNDLNFEFNTITAMLAREDSTLRPRIGNLDTTLGVLANREAALQGTLVNGAAVFSQLNSALRVPGAVAGLTNIFNQSAAALTCTEALGSSLEPVIASVNPNVANLDVLLGEFITATGYYSNPANVDSLRVNAYVAGGGTESGGVQQEHKNEGLGSSGGESAHPVATLPGGCSLSSGGGR
jgi:phospholipid/cholesterol/gamma-HCH transport system substrate-binding protein